MPPVSSRTTMMSTPCKSSDLIGEASSTAGWGTTGRRFANRPSSLRSRRSPCSGRTLASGADHFGPPTAPRRMASELRHSARVAAGNASPAASMAAPPTSADSNRNAWPCRSATRDSARTASAVTSGPMPSPPSTAIRACILGSFPVSASGWTRGLVTLDVLELALQVTELVHAVQQAVACERLDRERHGDARRQSHRRGIQVDGDIGARMLDEPLRGGLVDEDRQEPVLQRIVAEDIRDLGADHGPNPVIHERPGRMFTRGAAAEIADGDQHLAE